MQAFLDDHYKGADQKAIVDMTDEELDTRLAHAAVALRTSSTARTKKGDNYSRTSLINIFLSVQRRINLHRDAEFKRTRKDAGKVNLFRDRRFLHFQDTLDAKCKE